jgi:PTH1 family peptidyl-tRNA hydrolase
MENLGSREFPRLRVGVGRGKSRNVVLADHVMADFSAAENEALQSALRRATEAIECFLQHGIDKAMNDFN